MFITVLYKKSWVDRKAVQQTEKERLLPIYCTALRLLSAFTSEPDALEGGWCRCEQSGLGCCLRSPSSRQEYLRTVQICLIHWLFLGIGVSEMSRARTILKGERISAVHIGKSKLCRLFSAGSMRPTQTELTRDTIVTRWCCNHQSH